MRKIPIGNVEEGMVLAKPLVKPDGKILLAQGCVLSERIISRLDDWGFDIVFVEGEAESSDEKVKIAGFDMDNCTLEEITSVIENRFCKCHNSITLKLKQALIGQITRKFNENEDARQKRTQEVSEQN